MVIKELAAMIHQNAVEHGWWDEEHELPELTALIHGEWSEALEEARAGRPMVWYSCGESLWHRLTCDPKDETECRMFGREEECEYRGRKPEGIAVELIDGCIRILDVLGYEKADFLDQDTGEQTDISELIGTGKHAAARAEEIPQDVPTLIAWLHVFTSHTLLDTDHMETPEVNLVGAMSLALSWVQMQGIDPIALLMRKHEYNKGRPYKHGKMF